MPRFPLTPCLEPRCPHPAVQRGRCERHRQSTSQRGYGRAWQATSRAMRALHGQCERCGAVDDLTTDHLLPRSMGGTDDRVNLRVLCRSCHGAVGAKAGGPVGSPRIARLRRPLAPFRTHIKRQSRQSGALPESSLIFHDLGRADDGRPRVSGHLPGQPCDPCDAKLTVI